MHNSFWPEGKSAAISITFDDARPSQIDVAVPILDRHGVFGTFYVSPAGVEERLAGWRAAVARGHEIANHTFSHPCSGNSAGRAATPSKTTRPPGSNPT